MSNEAKSKSQISRANSQSINAKIENGRSSPDFKIIPKLVAAFYQ
jgi:hypothetical protein